MDRGDVCDARAFGCSDHGGGDRAEREIAIPRDEFGDAHPVGGGNGFDDEVAGCKISQETHFGIHTESRSQQVGHLGNREVGTISGPGCVSRSSRLAA